MVQNTVKGLQMENKMKSKDQNLEQKLEGIIKDITNKKKVKDVKKLWKEYEELLTDCYKSKFKDYEFNKAIKVLDQIIEINPKNSKVWIEKGDLYGHHGRGILDKRDDVLRCYDRALEINPKNADALHRKAIEYEFGDWHEKALEFYDKALEITPEDTDILEYKASLLADELGRPREALKVYNQLLRMDSRDDMALNDKARILNKLSRYHDALRCINRAIEISPTDKEYYFNKGVILDNLGRFKEAYGAYCSAVLTNEKFIGRDSELFNNQGAAAAENGRYKTALKCFDKALESYPRYEKAKKNKEIVLQALEESKKIPGDLIGISKKLFVFQTKLFP